MKLTRIAKLKLRVFRDFVWPKDLHPFARFNLIYGWNGSGKTTLAWLLSLVEKQMALIEGEVELEFDGTTKIKGSSFASAGLPQIRVFNRDFVNATLSQTSGIAPIYFLGKDSIEKQAQVDELKKGLAEIKAEVGKAESTKRSAEKELDDFCVGRAKLIKELLTTANNPSYNNYDKRNFRRAVEALDAQSAAAALLTDEEKARLRSQKDAQPKPTIDKIAAPSVDLDALTREVDALVTRSVVAQTLDELTRDARLAKWVQEGLMLHSGEHASDTCRFCLQPLQAWRRAALEAHFNDAFARFQQDLAGLFKTLESVKRALGSVSLPDVSRFYETLASDASEASQKVSSACAEAQTAIEALMARVAAKRDQPFAPAVTAGTVSGSTRSSLADAVAAFNAVIEEHNKISVQFKPSVDEACKKLEASYVAEARAEFAQRSDAVKTATSALETVNKRYADVRAKIDELERDILQHHRAADELTAELRAYLGRDELRFETKDTGYALTRNGEYVQHLSEGERTAIAFLYFLKSLQDKSFDLKNGIVVIDDPVSSLDDNALFSAFGYMKERTKEAGQLFIFTHSFSFFRLVKNWFHHLPGQRKKQIESRPARFFLLRSRRYDDGSRTSELGNLDRLLEEHESEYQYLFKCVYQEANRSDVVELERYYGLPNVARRLLEAFLAFRFPDMSGDLQPCLDRVAFDNAKKTRILRLLNTYSHAGAIADPEHDLSLLAETQPVLRDLLELMKAVDKDHYDGLIKIVTLSSVEEQGEP
ncbi:MAG: Translation-disabling ACNase RloC [Candidatus Ozemobacter sibiricus]|jgi:wobble nucleotide-excising tRNase|uniref:Translation-disabling ACNase RloC n=1 Tax=Candidatus Ozemobacter sibiricus TaxID=2268124 RepID=A0A367ZNN8_9BACT|nr:MAG: Translation-disabling ACNase RloC [Candidatus Ozemobacter sibiricus]